MDTIKEETPFEPVKGDRRKNNTREGKVKHSKSSRFCRFFQCKRGNHGAENGQSTPSSSNSESNSTVIPEKSKVVEDNAVPDSSLAISPTDVEVTKQLIITEENNQYIPATDAESKSVTFSNVSDIKNKSKIDSSFGTGNLSKWIAGSGKIEGDHDDQFRSIDEVSIPSSIEQSEAKVEPSATYTVGRSTLLKNTRWCASILTLEWGQDGTAGTQKVSNRGGGGGGSSTTTARGWNKVDKEMAKAGWTCMGATAEVRIYRRPRGWKPANIAASERKAKDSLFEYLSMAEIHGVTLGSFAEAYYDLDIRPRYDSYIETATVVRKVKDNRWVYGPGLAPAPAPVPGTETKTSLTTATAAETETYPTQRYSPHSAPIMPPLPSKDSFIRMHKEPITTISEKIATDGRRRPPPSESPSRGSPSERVYLSEEEHLYWLTRFPWPMKKRDYNYARRAAYYSYSSGSGDGGGGCGSGSGSGSGVSGGSGGGVSGGKAGGATFSAGPGGGGRSGSFAAYSMGSRTVLDKEDENDKEGTGTGAAGAPPPAYPRLPLPDPANAVRVDIVETHTTFVSLDYVHHHHHQHQQRSAEAEAKAELAGKAEVEEGEEEEVEEANGGGSNEEKSPGGATAGRNQNSDSDSNRNSDSNLDSSSGVSSAGSSAGSSLSLNSGKSDQQRLMAGLAGSTSFRFISQYYDDPKVFLPPSVINLLTKKALPEGCRSLYREAKLLDKERGITVPVE